MGTRRAIPIQKLRVQNFGCVRDATVEFEPLTVLVGPNDSGKSMLLRALPTMASAGLAEEGWRAVFPNEAALTEQTFNSKGGAPRFEINGAVGAEDYSYDVELIAGRYGVAAGSEYLKIGPAEATRTDKGLLFRSTAESTYEGPSDWFGSHIPLLHEKWTLTNQGYVDEVKHFQDIFRGITPLFNVLRTAPIYALRPEHLRRPTRIDETAHPGEDRWVSLSPDGRALSHAVAHLLLRGREVLERIERALATAMPQVKRIDVRELPQIAGQSKFGYQLELVIQSGARIPSRSISDGVLLFLGYLYLALGPDPAPLLLIEEPETGIHPGLLRKLVQLFRDMTTGAHGGPPTQIVLTTHSPMLLNLVEPEEIRVIQRGADGATTVTPFMAAPDIDRLLGYQGPGEIWVNQGEEYLTRGSKASP